ncbi:MAG: hypothetical protein ACR2MP_12235 [Streptosporangiaceae bacterium]
MVDRVKPDYSAAWVPDDDPGRPWGEAAQLACDWIRSQGRASGSRPLLVTYSFGNSRGAEELAGLDQVTVRSRGSVLGLVGRPVLAYVPEASTFELAHRYARKAALCVVESVGFPLHGWAREVRATNLLSGEVLPALGPQVLKDLDMLDFAGNNSWGDQYGKKRARDILQRLDPLVDLAEVLGYVMAHGTSHHGVKNLVNAAKAIGWTDPDVDE